MLYYYGHSEVPNLLHIKLKCIKYFTYNLYVTDVLTLNLAKKIKTPVECLLNTNYESERIY